MCAAKVNLDPPNAQQWAAREALVTAGQRSQFIPVLAKVRVTRAGGGRPRTHPDMVLAD
jgi:hypothetical protein